MGYLVAPIEEIRTRLAAAMGGGGTLTDVKAVYVGTREQIRTDNDSPYIVIGFPNGSEAPESTNNQISSTMQIDVIVVMYRLEGNQLYAITGSKGIGFLLERVLNAIDKNTSGVVDLKLAGTVMSRLNTEYGFDMSESSIKAVIRLTVQTAKFTQGAR